MRSKSRLQSGKILTDDGKECRLTASARSPEVFMPWAAPDSGPFLLIRVKGRQGRRSLSQAFESFARFTIDKGRPRGAALIQAPGRGA